MQYQKGTFVVVPSINRLDILPATGQALFVWLCKYANEDGECFPSRKRLADHLGIDVRTIDKHLSFLEETGFITKVKRKKAGTKENMSNLYQIQISRYPSENNNTTPSEENDTVTIPNSNYTNITTIALVDKPQTREPIVKAKTEGLLPDYLGKTTLTRILKLYSLLWQDKYGQAPTAIPFGKAGALLKPIIGAYTEYQIACLLKIHFSWHGTTGDDDFVYKQISNRGFSLTDFRRNVDLYIAYLTNSLHVEYNSPDSVRQYAVKALGVIIKKFKDEKGIK